MYNYEDEHIDEFYHLLFDELLVYVRKINIDAIISTLSYDGSVRYSTLENDGLHWLYTADRKEINKTTMYSFRFPNAVHPEFYRTFFVEHHPKFQSIEKRRHGLSGWYEYVGSQLLEEIDSYLRIKMVSKNQNAHRTQLFINRQQERLDIKISFPQTRERIAINFESGYPALVKQ